MKKPVLIAAGAVLLTAAVLAFVYVKNENNSMNELFNANVEALTWCEIDGKIIKEACEGNEGTCTIKKFGHTLTCNGRQVKR